VTTPVTASSSTISGSATTTRQPGGALGKDEFLKILVTQLRNQDPLSPMDSSQFASQLAQFSSLEQLIQLNEGLATQTAASASSTLAINTSLGASLIGRTVLASGSQLIVGSSEQLSVTADIGGTGTANIVVLDASGREVARRTLGTVSAGRQTLSWDNDVDGVPELMSGTYTYELTVTNSDGAAVQVQPFVRGRVDGVSFQNGSVVLRVGGMDFALDQLAEIEPAAGMTARLFSPFRSE
jgi:flagellar basal-body rod modification protein FlgD